VGLRQVSGFKHATAVLKLGKHDDLVLGVSVAIW
jgi:hypothetical protein